MTGVDNTYGLVHGIHGFGLFAWVVMKNIYQVSETIVRNLKINFNFSAKIEILLKLFYNKIIHNGFVEKIG